VGVIRLRTAFERLRLALLRGKDGS
jgi:hypothetical protein